MSEDNAHLPSPLELLVLASSGDIENIQKLFDSRAINQDSVKNHEGFTPLHVAAQNGQIIVCTYLLQQGANPNVKAIKGQTPLQLAAMKGDLATVRTLIGKNAEPNLPGFDGMTPIYAAALANKAEVVSYLLTVGADPLVIANTSMNAIEIAGKRGHTEVLQAFQSFADGTKCKGSSIQQQPLTQAELQRKLAKSTSGLLGFESFSKLFAIDLFDFIQSTESRIRLFWGDSGTGKSELGMRLAGLRDGIPRLNYKGTGAYYFSAADDGMNFGTVADKISPKSIVYLDDADKLFDSENGLKDMRDVVQLQQSLNTSIIKKPVYWVLSGSFDSIRKGGGLSEQGLEKIFGRSLAHKIDYIDWRLPSWTLENLLKAVKLASSRRGLTYEDEALLLISQYCLTHGAVIGFDRIDQTLFRRNGGQKGTVTADEAKRLISSLGTTQA